MEISNIKLRVNHNVNFNLEDAKIKNLLIISNTINFFGFFNDGRINMMSMNKNDRYHYMWLLKRCKEKTNIYIIGESEECEYYTNLFNYFGSLGIRVNWKFMETKEPKDYLEKLSLLKNMKFDYIVGNPPFGSVGGDTLHLKCLDMVYDKFTKKMLIIMPWGFVTKDTRSFKKYQIKFAPKLQHVKEIAGNNFEGTSMFSTAIYEFDNNISKTTIIEDINGNTIEKDDLTNISKFNEYENNILKYLEIGDSIKVCYGFGGYDRHWRDIQKTMSINDFRNWLNNNIDKSLEEVKHNYINNSYLITNLDNGAMNGQYMTSKTGKIFNSYNDLLNFFKNVKPGYRILILKSNKEAKNCKITLQNPLFRFILYKTQIDQHIYDKKTYKYIPAIDWEDERCLTDEGLLEMCGCPKDKAKEYAEYVKNYVEERDKEFENKKKRK